ncbi:MAG: type III-B CRISPR module RAMP protein Cmr6 [Bacteroidia bacterium]|nr:type III-B CRISPR module RAMP protein Cmr6 [Bacteroidia bacterium]
MEEINFALALNKLHKDNHKSWKILDGEEIKIKKLSERFFTKKKHNNKQIIVKQELDNFDFKGLNFDSINTKQKDAIESLCDNKYGYIDFEPDWRFIIGLGGASVYETGITLHHIYGIPYIPATSIKGTVRSWYLLDKYHDKKKEIEGYAIANDETFCKAFGCPKELKIEGKSFQSILKHGEESAEFEGNIIFFDAFPLTKIQIKLDVMTPHYQPYYDDNKGKTPPADYFSPNPIMFLTVEKTTFRMYFGVKKEANQNLVSIVKEWLDKALVQRGIGAKTAVGYGYQKKDPVPQPGLVSNTGSESGENTGTAGTISTKPEALVEPKEGLEMIVEVVDIKTNVGLVMASMPSNKFQQFSIINAPKNIKISDRVKVKCKMKKNKKDKLESFIFVAMA